jgi:peroxiredoxin
MNGERLLAAACASRTLRVIAAGYLACSITSIACKSKEGVPAQASSEAPAPPAPNKPKSFPSAPLTVGAEVFDFSALAHTGQSVRLSDYLKKPVVVYFCPQDAQPACTALATSVRDVWADLHSQVDMVYGVSREATILRREFAADTHLPHLLLSDSDDTVHRIFGVQSGMVVGYLIGVDRKVLHVFAPPNAGGFGPEILSVVVAKGLERPQFPI